ncbi:MAG: metal ABC transporter permease [Firmicutes bacterium]|jgi:zinc transport system permease protein|nr:metal ABC transporter permease [Bacillota bacterium]
MGEFFQALQQFSFMQNAVAAGILASLASGIIGTYVVVKRITFISGGIAHAVLGGMGVAYYLGADPLHGAIAAAVFSALLMGFVNLRAKQHEDTIMGALWAVGMAVGIIFMSLTPGYNVDLMSFLFGNILMVTDPVLRILLILDAAILLIVAVFYRQFMAVVFDEEQARLRGLPVDFLYMLLLCLIALTVVILMKIVGLILVIALLTLPAAIAGLYTSKLSRMMVAASLLSLGFTLAGLIASYHFNLPAGAVIVVLTGLGYLIALAAKRVHTHLLRRQSQSSVGVEQ